MELNSEKREKYESIHMSNLLKFTIIYRIRRILNISPTKAWSQISEKLARISKLCTMNFDTNATKGWFYNDGF